MEIRTLEILKQYLVSQNIITPDESIHITELKGGVSCITLKIVRAQGEDFVIKQALEKLKVQEDWFSDPERIHIEAAAMKALKELMLPESVPRLIFEDKELHIIGMEAVPDPHDNWKQVLLKGKLYLHHVKQFGEMLGRIQLGSLNHPVYQKSFANRHFFKTLRLDPYYAFTASQVPEAGLFLHQLIEDTLKVQRCLVHGDYSPKNILIYQNRLILLDHEVMHFGDGTFDVGFSMTHLLSKARHVTGKKEAFQQAAKIYWDTYRSAFPVAETWEQRAVRHTIACMLARVKGKSQLEYLSQEKKDAQSTWCLQRMQELPAHMYQLIDLV